MGGAYENKLSKTMEIIARQEIKKDGLVKTYWDKYNYTFQII